MMPPASLCNSCFRTPHLVTRLTATSTFSIRPKLRCSSVAMVSCGLLRPSKVDRRWLDPTLGRTAYVHVTHSGVDWFAFSLWRKGRLVRSLSVSPDGGVQEQIGNPLSFEAPYWGGQFPVEVDDDREPYPLAFHPLDLSEASMLQHLGFQFGGNSNDWVCDPAEVPVARFAIQKAGWKLW